MSSLHFRSAKRRSWFNPSTPPLRYRLLWQGLGWMMIAAIVWLSLTPNPPQPPPILFLTWDKAQHALAYACLMFWYRQAFLPHWRWPAFLLALGVVLEFLQGLGGVRSFDVRDMLANSIGVALGLILAKTWLGGILAKFDAWVARASGGRLREQR